MTENDRKPSASEQSIPSSVNTDADPVSKNDNTETDTDDKQKTRYSPTGFEAPTAEINDEMVVCLGCGEADPASEMGILADETISNDDDEVLRVTRRYIHDDVRCAMEVVKSQPLD